MAKSSKPKKGGGAKNNLMNLVQKNIDNDEFLDLHWAGTISDYLKIVNEEPNVTRDAYQRLYDMILSYGTEEYVAFKDKLVRYKFFSDPMGLGKDAIFGLDRPLMKLVDAVKSGALKYGAEKRVMLLHGPVG